MTIREIIKADAATISGKTKSVLRTSYTSVDFLSEKTFDLIRDLKDTLHSDSLSVGLAAPQIGYHEAIAVINVSKGKPASSDLILINPKIIKMTGKKDLKYESCMSIPHKKGRVERRKKIELTYLNSSGIVCSLKADGFLARVISHEVDHLNGILFSDRLCAGDKLEETEIFREHGVNMGE